MNVYDTELRQTFRAHIIFEQITGETFTGKNLTQVITFFYSTVMACNDSLNLEFDQFINDLDLNPDWLTEFVAWLTANERKNETLNPTKEKKTVKQPTKKNRSLN